MPGRRRTLAFGLCLLAALGAACSSAEYYRMPRTPGADGSMANEVEWVFFSMVKPRHGLPHAYTEFNPDTDDQVVFFVAVQTFTPSMTLRGVLYRPDGLEHASFARTVRPFPRGRYYNYATDESFPMTTLRPHMGRWRLRLFLDESLIGTYEFVLADKARIREFRPAR